LIVKFLVSFLRGHIYRVSTVFAGSSTMDNMSDDDNIKSHDDNDNKDITIDVTSDDNNNNSIDIEEGEESSEDDSAGDAYIHPSRIVDGNKKVKQRTPQKIPKLDNKIKDSIDYINELKYSGIGKTIWENIEVQKVKDSECLIPLKGTFDDKGYPKNIRVGTRHFKMDDPKDKRKRKKKISTCPTDKNASISWKCIKKRYDTAKEKHVSRHGIKKKEHFQVLWY